MWLKKKVFEGDYEELLKQFSYVPIISEFYLTIFYFLNKFKIIPLNDVKNMSLVFPADNGLFLGELNFRSEPERKGTKNAFETSLKTFIDDEILKGEEQLLIKDNLIKIFTQTSKTIENPFLMPSGMVANENVALNLFSHSIFYFQKFMLIKDDIIYLMSKEKNTKFDNENFFRLDKAFVKLNTMFNEVKSECGIADSASIDEISKKLDTEAFAQYL